MVGVDFPIGEGEELWGRNSAVLRWIPFKGYFFADSNVLIKGRMITGEKTRSELERLKRDFRREYKLKKVI